jgi:hypothetical protein
MMEDRQMKVVEYILRDAWEKTHKASKNISTLPPTELMDTILARRQSYIEINQISEKKNILQQ